MAQLVNYINGHAFRTLDSDSISLPGSERAVLRYGYSECPEEKIGYEAKSYGSAVAVRKARWNGASFVVT